MERSVGSMPPVCIAIPAPRLNWKVCALPLLVLLISPAFAGEGAYKPPASHYFCTSNPAPNTRYYSALFDMAASAQLEQQAGKAFRQFLSEKYGVHAAANCQGNPDQKMIQGQMQQTIAQLKSAKWKIVETGWTNSSSTQAGTGEASHPDCNDADAWKSVAEYKAACENGAQSSSSAAQPHSMP